MESSGLTKIGAFPSLFKTPLEEVISLLRGLHLLSLHGENDSSEADVIRDKMEASYKLLSQSEIEMVEWVSTALNTLEDKIKEEGTDMETSPVGVKQLLMADLTKITMDLIGLCGKIREWQLEIYRHEPTSYGAQVAETLKFHAGELQDKADKIREMVTHMASQSYAGKSLFARMPIVEAKEVVSNTVFK